MPFRSESQRRYLWANEPKVAQEWSDKYGTPKHLPKHVNERKARREAILRKMKG